MAEATGKNTATFSKVLSRADLWPIIGVVLICVLVYYPLFLGRAVMPDTWERFEPWHTELGFVETAGTDGPVWQGTENANNDAILLYIPWNKFAHDELNAGRIPAWDPHCLFGIPLASNHLVPVFYPVYALIAWLASPLFILGISGLIHTLIMGLFFYLFIREWMGNRVVAWFASSCLVISLIINPHYQPWPMTLAWFPAIWFFYERWLKHRSPWSGLWMSICWAFPLLSGYPSLFVQMSIFTAAWFFVRRTMLLPDCRPALKNVAGILILPFVLGLLLSGIQNVPTVMASMDSDRTVLKTSGELTREGAFTVPSGQPWQTHVKRILQPMIPFRFSGNDFFNRGYIGILPVIFALFGLGFVRRKDYPRPVLWLALIVLPFALVPTVNFAVYQITGGILIDPNPPLEVFGFLVLMLAAEGVRRLTTFFDTEKRDSIDKIRAEIIAVVAVVLVMVGTYMVNPESLIGVNPGLAVFLLFLFLVSIGRKKGIKGEIISLAVLVAISGFTAAGYYSPKHGNDGRPMPETPAVHELVETTGSLQNGEWGRMVRYSANEVNVMSLTGQPYTFYPNLGTYFGTNDAFGYHNLVPSSRFEFLRSIEPGAVIERRGIVAFQSLESIDDPRLGRMGVRYILSDAAIDGRGSIAEIPGVYVYGYSGETRNRITVVDPDNVEWNESGQGAVIDDSRPEGAFEAAWVLNEPGRVIVGIHGESPVGVIFNEGYASGWTAGIRGNPVEIRTVDGLAMYVEVPPGRQVVEFRYVMPGLGAGMGLTVLGFVLWVIIALAAGKRAKLTGRQDTSEE